MREFDLLIINSYDYRPNWTPLGPLTIIDWPVNVLNLTKNTTHFDFGKERETWIKNCLKDYS